MARKTPQERPDGAAPKKRGRPKGSLNKPKEPGRVVAVGVDTPRLSERLVDNDREACGAGRPTAYRDEFAHTARLMARLGATDFEIAEELCVTTQTIWRWRSKYPEFCYALDEGKDAFDNRIERSLAMRAAGYSIHTEKVFQYEGVIVRGDVIEHYPPDVGAIKLWLGNRRPDQWKDKQEVKLDGSEAFLKLWQAIGSGAIGK